MFQNKIFIDIKVTLKNNKLKYSEREREKDAM